MWLEFFQPLFFRFSEILTPGFGHTNKAGLENSLTVNTLDVADTSAVDEGIRAWYSAECSAENRLIFILTC
jgi:hypothetical protein